MKTCDNCGERVYALGCVNCDEEAYRDAAEVREQIRLDELLCAPCGRCGSPECFGGCEICQEAPSHAE